MSETKGLRIRKKPEGDEHERSVCTDCGDIQYENPRIVSTAVAVYHDPEDNTDKFLLTRTVDANGNGGWGLPTGYMKNGEKFPDGAIREAKKEAGADIKTDALVAIYELASKSEVALVFRAKLDSPNLADDTPTQESRLFAWCDIPWKELSSPLAYQALKAWKAAEGKTDFQPKMITAQTPLPKPPVKDLAHEEHDHTVCKECGNVQYQNPHIVNVSVIVYKDPATGEDLFLLAKRDIDPRKGYWTLPGGYMENGETIQQGAEREAHEEAGATVHVNELLAIYEPPRKNEACMIFRAEMTSADYKPGIESQDVKLFKWSEIPWKELAFPLVYEGLMAYQKFKDKTQFQPLIIESKIPVGMKPPVNNNAPKPPTP